MACPSGLTLDSHAHTHDRAEGGGKKKKSGSFRTSELSNVLGLVVWLFGMGWDGMGNATLFDRCMISYARNNPVDDAQRRKIPRRVYAGGMG